MLTAETEKSYGRNRRMTSLGKQSQFTPSRQAEPPLGPTVRNKANFRRRRVGRGQGDEGRGGQSCKTKPICLGRAGETIAKAAGLDATTRQAGQLRETKPVSGSAGWDEGERAKRTQFAARPVARASCP